MASFVPSAHVTAAFNTRSTREMQCSRKTGTATMSASHIRKWRLQWGVGTAVKRPLVISDFDAASISESVEKCVEFQRKFRMTEETDKKLRKYKKLLGLDRLDELRVPQHLIPPYFQFGSIGDPWYELSIKCVIEALNYQEKIPLRPVFHFDDWPSVESWDSCFATLASNDIKELWFYPNKFREHNADGSQLTLYRQAVAMAISKGCTPYSLFGGYFAILMSYDGLAGFGVGYGEWRDSSYHRGGSAQTRVYILKLHRYIDSAAAQSLIDKDPEYFSVGSTIMSDYVDAEKSVVDMSLADALDHFMECRHAELQFVSRPMLPLNLKKPCRVLRRSVNSKLRSMVSHSDSGRKPSALVHDCLFIQSR